MTTDTTGRGTLPATDTTEQRTLPATDTARAATAGAPSRPRVLVVGGGVAGLTAAYELRRRLGDGAGITLMSESAQFLLGPALLWVPFGRRVGTIGFSIKKGLERHGIAFVQARAAQIDPDRRVVRAQDREIPYDYLVIATGPRADGTAIPGVSGQFNATTSIWSEGSAVDTTHAVEQFLAQPGPAVVGAAPGAQYLSAAYEFALLLDYALRRRGTRDAATLTFVTPEPVFGTLDIDIPGAQRALERLFAQRHIRMITGASIDRVDHAGVHLREGDVLPAAYSMIIPPFTGVTGVWASPGLTDAQGFVPIDAHYRHARYPEIYAAGVAAHPAVSSSAMAALPKTGYLASMMAKAVARNVAVQITGAGSAAPPLPRLLDLRLIDGGDGGVLLLAADLGRPWRIALPLPGRATHWAKGLLTRYLLWKLRTGRASLP